MSTSITRETIERAADYWAGLLHRADKRDAFRAALIERLGPSVGERSTRLSVDYDPQDELLAALRDVGIDCRGTFFSADGLFPYKHRMYIDGTAITVAEGYGAPDRLLEVDP